MENTKKTKIELARIQAQHLHEINPIRINNVERTTMKLMRGMTTHELECAVRHWSKKR